MAIELRECPRCGKKVWPWPSGLLHTHINPATGQTCLGAEEAAEYDDYYVISLRDVAGLTFAEIAAELGLLSESAAQNRYLAAKRRDHARQERRRRKDH